MIAFVSVVLKHPIDGELAGRVVEYRGLRAIASAMQERA